MGGLVPACLILCAGKAKRLRGYPKQLLPVGNETFLARIVRQIRWRGGFPCVAIAKHGSSIQQHAYKMEVPCIPVGETDYVTETFALTVHKWQKRTIVLLGDVCYSGSIMNDIFKFDGPCGVWGHEWEIFAVSFSQGARIEILEALECVLMRASLPLKDAGQGKMRRFYQAYCNLPFGNALEKKPRKVLQYVQPGIDYTNDVDTPQDWQRFCVETLGRLDDLR